MAERPAFFAASKPKANPAAAAPLNRGLTAEPAEPASCSLQRHMGNASSPCQRRRAVDHVSPAASWARLVVRLISGPSIIAAWRRLLKKQLRIRRLQRIWGLLGLHLQQFPASLRQRLQRELKKQ